MAGQLSYDFGATKAAALSDPASLFKINFQTGRHASKVSCMIIIRTIYKNDNKNNNT